ncbi:hypothetical protein GTW37_27010, partial [Streptomyces sp. SID4931]
MGFGDWLRRTDRRRSAVPSPEGGSGHGDTSAVPATPAVSGEAEDRGDGDGGWDGGWRRVAPPSVTVARSSIGVSDGLRFRSRLASWQNPSLGGEL